GNNNTVTMPSLDLSNGLVRINGNLDVGTVTGTGVVLVTGTTTVRNQANLGSTDEVALASDGDLSLTGTGSTFRGSVYTGGNFKANNVTVEGVFIADAPNTTGNGGSSVQLTSVKVIGNPRMSHRSFTGINPAPQVVNSGTTDVLNPQGNNTPMTIYVDNGKYWIAQMPNTPPQPEDVFWNQTVVQYCQSLGYTISPRYPGWYNGPNGSQPHALDTTLNAWYNFHHFLQYAAAKPYTGSTGGSSSGGSSGSSYNYNLNQFISPYDQVRILLWQVL
ncbi:MAG: hypothetical protein ACYCW6_30110, partial [Candidatus Xenobia bacterium]